MVNKIILCCLLVTHFLYSSELYIGNVIADKSQVVVGIENYQQDIFISYGYTNIIGNNIYSSYTTTLEFSYINKKPAKNNINYLYGVSLGFVNGFTGSSYNGYSLSILTGYKYKFNEQISVKAYTAPISYGVINFDTNASITAWAFFSSRIGLFFYF